MRYFKVHLERYFKVHLGRYFNVKTIFPQDDSSFMSHFLFFRTDEHISQFARLGLRTLVLGHKIITQVSCTTKVVVVIVVVVDVFVGFKTVIFFALLFLAIRLSHR